LKPTRSPALPAPFDEPPAAAGIQPLAATSRLVGRQVDALLARSPSFYALPEGERTRLREGLVRIGSYAAELVRDDWAQSSRLGQRPMVRKQRTWLPESPVPLVRAQSAQANLRTSATGQVAGITQSTLRAIAFPTFVADLINGTFDAVIGATIKQMQAFMELVDNVSKTVDEFMRDNITDNQARDYLAQSYPDLFQIEAGSGEPRVVPTAAGDEAGPEALGALQGGLGLSRRPDALDEDTIDEQLVPAARRRLAQSRLQMLSSMVMMGLQRIVIRHGRIRATMGFHIDASDRASAQQASSFDFSHQNSVQGFFYVAFSARTSVAYVSSQQSDSDAAINVQANLTGEVDLTFETDYMPLNRLARAEGIERIRANTPNPEANVPTNQSAAMTQRRSDGPSSAQVVADRMQQHSQQSGPDIPAALVDAATGAAGGLAGMAGAAGLAGTGRGRQR